MKKLILGALLIIAWAASAPEAHALDVNNFTISSYEVQMTLGRDSEQRSTLAVKETITAQFPEYDQNHGLERAFVTDYDGHTLSLTIQSVTDSSSNVLNYHWSGNILRIGDSNSYVHGAQTYSINYTLRDVTKYYSDTNKDEFYWDAIGTDWQVPIERADVYLTLDGAIASNSSTPYCYVGESGSTDVCNLARESESQPQTGSEADSLTYVTSAATIGDGKGLTVAVGFINGTFADYQPSLFERIVAVWFAVQFVAGPLAVATVVWFVIRFARRLNRTNELGTIVAEYLPPKTASVSASARVAGYTRAVMTAQMLDLAVRHYIQIYEVKEKSLFGPAEYEIEVIQAVDDLRSEEQELLKDTFGTLPDIGQRMNLKTLQNNPSYYRRTLNNDAALDALIRGEYGFRQASADMKKWSRDIARALLLLALATISPFVLVAALVPFGLSFTCWRITDTGLALRRYLAGLKLYIGVAEAERIRMLQSPEGAEKVASVTHGTDSADLIKLYEKVLPYAVLFGLEKEWNKQLGVYYEASGVSPEWYSGHTTVFNAMAFSAAMSSFTQANNYASSSSSSSGGSSGGGFSGGGGGGGGGGGW